MNPPFPKISVVIPVKNEAGKIRECIEGILSQSIPVMEIIVIDSGSNDGTIEILNEYEIVKLIQIPSEQFNHGETRNLGVSHTIGEYVILTVGDAKPYDNDWIKNLLTGFDDERVAGVCGMQVVAHHKNNNPVEWFRPIDKVTKIKKYAFSKEAFEKLSPLEKKQVCSWDDVTAMYRRSVLLEIPFRKTSYCEDAIWAKDAIMAGYTIAYYPEARVYHYHLEDANFSFNRGFTGMYHMYKFFGLVYDMPKHNLRMYTSWVKTLLKAEGLSFAEKLKWWKYNLILMAEHKKAVKAVHANLEKGDAYFDEQHQKLCGKPPIPIK